MQYTKIYQNSYIVAIIVFIISCIVVYLFDFGCTFEIKPDGTFKKSFNWKYPVALALLTWLLWHFCLYPPSQNTLHDAPIKPKSMLGGFIESSPISQPINNPYNQKINMEVWN